MTRAKVEILKTVLGLAYADGKLADAEERLIDFLIDSYGLSPEEEGEVREAGPEGADPERLAEVLTDDQERHRAYEVASLICLMDGSQQPEESDMLRKIRDVLSIQAEQAVEIEGRARQIYARFAQHQSES